jgi:hypothetical protein
LAPRSKRSNSPLIHWRGTDAPRPVDQKPSAGWSRILLLLEGSRPTLSMAKFMRPYSLPRWFWPCSIRFSSTGGLTSPSGFSELVLSNSAWRGSRLSFSCRICEAMPGYVDYFDDLPADFKNRVIEIRSQINVAQIQLFSLWRSGIKLRSIASLVFASNPLGEAGSWLIGAL